MLFSSGKLLMANTKNVLPATFTTPSYPPVIASCNGGQFTFCLQREMTHGKIASPLVQVTLTYNAWCFSPLKVCFTINNFCLTKQKLCVLSRCIFLVCYTACRCWISPCRKQPRRRWCCAVSIMWMWKAPLVGS